MLINLSKLLSGNNDTKTFHADIERGVFQFGSESYPIMKKEPVELMISNTGRKLTITGTASITLQIPCDRCLEDVATVIEFQIEKYLNLNEQDSAGSDELQTHDYFKDQDYIEGNSLNTDTLIFAEILINMPAKILCKKDCKGLCTKCGADLNIAECGCDRQVADPRMSAVRDIFNNFKENALRNKT